MEYNFSNTVSFEDNFSNLNSSKWFFDDNISFDGNDSTFYETNGSFSNDNLVLTLSNNGLNGASFKSVDFYGYGIYEIRMKPANGCGFVSSFFLFQDFVDLSQYWNEIDIEFLCNGNTKQIQFNHWNAPGNSHEYLINEPFELRSDFNTYKIEYTPTYIKWYINNILYHQVTSDLPNNQMRIMMNIWKPTYWDVGTFNSEILPISSVYDYVKFYQLIGEKQMGVKFHGIELVGDSHIKNTKLEALISNPSLSTGRVWYDSVNNVYKGFDSSIAREFKNNVDIENILYQRKDKEAVRVATTELVDITECPTTIDGVTLATGDRVLVKDANPATDNGIFVVGTIGTYASLTRALDADNSPEGEVMQGMHVWVSDGAINGGSAWLLETANPITIGTTSLSFKYFSTSGTPITAGTGILDTIGSLSVKLDGTTITSSVNGIKVQDGLVYQDFLAFEDTPSAYGTAGQILVVNGTGDGFIFVDKIDSILDNTDTPSSFGNVGDTLVVNSTQDGFVWANPFTNIQTELNNTQSSAGLNVDGTYSAPGTSNYLSGTTDLVDCAVALDGKLATLATNYNAEFYSVQTSTAALTHTIKHNLNTAFPEVTVWAYDSGTSTWNIDVQDVAITDNNTIDITLAASENVRVVVRKGSALTIENNLIE